MSDFEKNVIGKFDCYGDQANVGTRWTRWLQSFELFVDSQGILIAEGSDKNKQRRRAQLLHYAGPDVQDIFYTLENTGEVNDYAAAVNALNAYFAPKVNSAYARHTFRQLQQNASETVSQFASRLKRYAKDCDYGTDTDNQIRDQILQKCKSDYLRRKLLEEGQGLTLARTLEFAQQCEKVDAQMASLSLHSTQHNSSNDQPVNRIAPTTNSRDQRPRNSRRPRAIPHKESTCYRCGNTGHYSRDPTCPARGKICSYCGGPNHFAAVCKSESSPTSRVYLVHQMSGDESEDEPAFAFHLKDSSNRGPTVKANIGGVDMQILVDSGATKNIVDVTTLEWLKQNHISCESKAAQRHKKLYSYASTTPLQVKGTFSTTVKIGVRETTAEFLVIKGKGTPLLGHETATLLGVLRIGPLISDVSSVEEKPAKRKDKIEQEVLRRVEEAKAVMEKQILEELEKKRSEEQEFQLKKEKQERKERELLKKIIESKNVEIDEMKRKLAEERLSMVAEKRQLLEEKRNAQEEIIKTDNGPQLNAAEFNAKYCTANCITHEKATPRWAQANGEVARRNRSMEKRKNELQKYVTKYRGLHQTTTGKSLAELMLNRCVKGKLPDQV